MKAKKFAATLLTFLMTVSLLSGCTTENDRQSVSKSDNGTTTESNTENNQSEAASEDEETTENTTVSAKGGKTLVVYYSATGNTKSVAETIAEVTGGDLFEIEPKEPYTDDDLDWTDDNSRVSREHDDESLRDVELVCATVDNWDSYETVYIGA